tara:strand:+ start:3587 stop:4750 length:1164 start_codon:yes stop_codon:yes gene_type:complete
MEIILRSFGIDPKDVSEVEEVGKNQYKVLMKDGKTVKLGGKHQKSTNTDEPVIQKQELSKETTETEEAPEAKNWIKTTINELDTIGEEIDSIESGDLAQLSDKLRQRRKVDAEKLGKLHRRLDEFRKIPNIEESEWGPEYKRTLQMIETLTKKNPYAAEISKANEEAINKQKREDRLVINKAKEKAKELNLRKDTIPLHNACQGKNGFVALRVNCNGIIAIVRLKVQGKKGRIVDTEDSIDCLKQCGTTHEGNPRWVSLQPPNFKVPDSEKNYFPITIENGLADLYRWEEHIRARNSKTNTTAINILNGDKGCIVIHKKNWTDYHSKNTGHLTIEIEGLGNGKIKVNSFESKAHDLRDLVGITQDISTLNPGIKNILVSESNYKKNN